MKHLHFVQSLEPLQGGGLGGAALGLHLAQLAAGQLSSLITTRAAGFRREWDNVEQFVRGGLQKAFYARGVRTRASEVVDDCDVVHGHGFYTYMNWVLGAEARRLEKPLVYHVQGFLDPWILRRSRIKKALAGLLFENENFRHVSLWRALTKKEEVQIREIGVKAEVIIAPNGVHLEDYDESDTARERMQYDVRRREKRLLFLARLHPKKGLDLLISAWADLVAEFSDWELLIVGPDENGYQAVVEGLIKAHGLENTCRILPAVTGKQKNAVLRTADLFVLPSYSEGFPVAVLEAAAHSLSVVLTNECNFPELVEVGGAWEAHPEVSSLRKTLRQAMEADSLERRHRGAAARRLVEDQYTWSKIGASITAACEARWGLRASSL